MAEKKELYEVLFEEVNHKMDLVLEGYTDMNRKFEEAQIDRQQIREDLTQKIEFVAHDLNNKIEKTRIELKETRNDLTNKIEETRNELKETRNDLKKTREELGQKIDKVVRIVENHEMRINSLEKKANVG